MVALIESVAATPLRKGAPVLYRIKQPCSTALCSEETGSCTMLLPAGLPLLFPHP